MKSISIINSKTPVKFFVYTALSLVMFGSGSVSWGQATPTTPAVATAAASPTATAKEKSDSDSELKLLNARIKIVCGEESSPNYKDCAKNFVLGRNTKDSCEEYRSLEKDLSKACSDSGLGLGECTSAAKMCGGAFSNSDTEFQVAQVLGELAQTNIYSSGCPQFSGQSYESKKKSYDQKLEDYDEKIKKVNEKFAESKKKMDEKIVELKEKVTKAKEEFQKRKEKMSSEAQEQVQKLFEIAQSRTRQLEKMNKDILQKNQSLTVLFQQKNATLTNASSDKVKIACDVELAKAKKEYDSSLKSSGNIFSNTKEKKAFLLSKWNSCKEQISIGIQSSLEKNQQDQDLVRTEISNIESEKERINDQATFEAQQQAEKQKADEASISAEDARIIQLASDIDSQISQAQQYLADESKSSYQELLNYEKLKKETLLKITQLGPVPPGGDTNKSVKSASNEIDRVTSSMNNSRYDSCKGSSKSESDSGGGPARN